MANVYFHKPENALKRATELSYIGNKKAALQVLHDVLTAKKSRTWQLVLEQIMTKYVDICVDLQMHRHVKDGLHQYRNISQQQAPNSLETVIKYLLKSAEKKANEAFTNLQNTKEKKLVVDDLENEQTPESVMLSTMTEEGDSERSEREVLVPWLKFLWETYRSVLDILKTNSKLEKVYHETSVQAFEFCRKFERKTELRRLCETLRQHLANLQRAAAQAPGVQSHRFRGWEGWTQEGVELHLTTRFAQLDVASTLELWTEGFRTVEDIYSVMKFSKKPPKAKVMAKYYDRLTRMFWVSKNYLFHAYTWWQFYQLAERAEASKKTQPTEEEKAHRAASVLFAALCIPDHPSDENLGTSETAGSVAAQQYGSGSSLLQQGYPEDDVDAEKNARMATLLGFTTRPTRSALLAEVVDYFFEKTDILPAHVKKIYEILETTFSPLTLASTVEPLLTELKEKTPRLAAYAEPLSLLAASRVVRQLAVVYSSMDLDKFRDILSPLKLSEKELDKLVVGASPFSGDNKPGTAFPGNGVVARFDYRHNSLNFVDDPSASESALDDDAHHSEVRDLLLGSSSKKKEWSTKNQGLWTPPFDTEDKALLEDLKKQVAEHCPVLEEETTFEKKSEEVLMAAGAYYKITMALPSYDLLSLGKHVRKPKLPPMPPVAPKATGTAALSAALRQVQLQLLKAKDLIDEESPDREWRLMMSDRREKLYEKVRASAPAEHERCLARKAIIERRKEEQERLQQEKFKAELQEKQRAEDERKLEEANRLRREARERKQEQYAKMQSEMALQETKEVMKSLGADVAENELTSMDDAKRKQLIEETREQAQKQREAEEQRFAEQAKRLDYVTRALRLEELPVLKSKYAELCDEDKKAHDAEYETMLELDKKDHADKMQEKERLAKTQSFRPAFEAVVTEARKRAFEKRREEQKQARLLERRNRKIARARRRFDEAKEEEERLKIEADEEAFAAAEAAKRAEDDRKVAENRAAAQAIAEDKALADEAVRAALRTEAEARRKIDEDDRDKERAALLEKEEKERADRLAAQDRTNTNWRRGTSGPDATPKGDTTPRDRSGRGLDARGLDARDARGLDARGLDALGQRENDEPRPRRGGGFGDDGPPLRRGLALAAAASSETTTRGGAFDSDPRRGERFDRGTPAASSRFDSDGLRRGAPPDDRPRGGFEERRGPRPSSGYDRPERPSNFDRSSGGRDFGARTSGDDRGGGSGTWRRGGGPTDDGPPRRRFESDRSERTSTNNDTGGKWRRSGTDDSKK